MRIAAANTIIDALKGFIPEEEKDYSIMEHRANISRALALS
jgi:hypothetical protein